MPTFSGSKLLQKMQMKWLVPEIKENGRYSFLNKKKKNFLRIEIYFSLKKTNLNNLAFLTENHVITHKEKWSHQKHIVQLRWMDTINI